MVHLPNVTVAIVDCYHYKEAIDAVIKTLEQIKPHSVVFITDKHPRELNLKENELLEQVDFIQLDTPITSKEAYSQFIIKELWRYITTSHILVIQHDGYVIDGSVWDDEFLEYDYIGAPWNYKDDRNVGNGGFSLRSKRLMVTLASDPFIEFFHPEDEIIGRLYRRYLEHKHKIKFAPEELAHRFSYECHMPMLPTFGFHNFFWKPFQPRVIIHRSGAMGDIIMAEPVMEYFHKKGYLVFLDIPADIFPLFDGHHYPLFHISQLQDRNVLTIDLDMAYENNPKQLALKSYFESFGALNYVLRNSKLNFPITDQSKLFKKYVVMHVDDTAMDHRNAHGVNWHEVAAYLKEMYGYTVITIGNGSREYGTFMRCTTKMMMMYVLAGADMFIGIDSGVAQVAVALGIKSVIMFGSVNPVFRYHDLSNITVIQNACPVKKDGCYHEVVSTVGKPCEVKVGTPPCITHNSESIISKLPL
jgi:hypothetical protein